MEYNQIIYLLSQIDTISMTKMLKNSHFLAFLYELSQASEILSFKGMAELQLATGKRLHQKTIKRWFSHLKKEQFHYYPLIDYSNFSLEHISVLYPSSSELALPTKKSASFFPKKISSKTLMKFSPTDQYRLETFIVPQKSLTGWKQKVKRKIPLAHFLSTKNEFVLYNRFHQMFSTNGDINFSKGEFSDQNMQKLQRYLSFGLDKIHSVGEESASLFKNEALKYILLDKVGSWKNSPMSWNSLQESGVDLWQHFRSRKKSEAVGIKRIQQAIRKIKVPLQQKLFYAPLFRTLRHVHLIGEISQEQILQFCKQLEKHCLSISVHHGKQSIISLHLDIIGLQKMIDYLHHNPCASQIFIHNDGWEQNHPMDICSNTVTKSESPIHLAQ